MIDISTVRLPLGRLPNDPSAPRLRLSRFLAETAPTYPENIDWLSRVSYWPMYLNDAIGDCTCAAAGHIIQNLSTYGDKKEIRVQDDDVLRAYSAVSGFDPSTGANDNGAIMQEVLSYWRKTGVGGHRILAFAEVDVHNKDELRAAAHIFGNLYIGFNVPDSIWREFDAGTPWTVHPGSPVDGGHCVNVGWYDVSDNMWKVVTWGRVQAMTQEFWDKYVDEAWVVISEEWWDEQGKNPEGLDLTELGRQFTLLTGEKNPFENYDPNNPPPPPEPYRRPWYLRLWDWLRRVFGSK